MIERWNVLRRQGWLQAGPRLGYSLAALGLVGNVICFALQAHWASVGFTLIAIAGLGVADLRGLFCLAFPAMSLAGVTVSLGYIESGAYMSEQRRAGFNVGATPLFGIYAIAFLTLAHGVLTWLRPRMATNKPSVPRAPLLGVLVALSGLVGVAYVAIFVGYGTGLSYRTRFEWVQTLPPGVAMLHSMLRMFVIPVIFALLGIFGSLFGVRRSWPWLTITIVPIITLIGTGEKFSSFIVIICMVFTGVGIGGYTQGREIQFRGAHAPLGLGLGVLLLISVVTGYARQVVTSPFAAILDRLALQGHVWFGMYARFGGVPAVPLPNLLRRNSLKTPSGLDLLSYYVSDYNFVRRRIGEGLSFTMGGPPGALGAFGDWWGLLVYALLGLLYVLAIVLAVYFLKRRLPLVLPFALVFYVLVNTATQMGYWEALYGSIAFMCYAVMGVAVAVTEVRRARKRKEASVAMST